MQLGARLDADALHELRREASRLADDMTESTVLESDGVSVRSVFNVHSRSEVVRRRLLENDDIVAIAQQIIGPKIYVHQAHINYKRPFVGGEYFWHSDFTFWYWEDGMALPRAISLLVFLDDQRVETGPLCVVPGSHMWITHETWRRPVEDHRLAVRHGYEDGVASAGLVDLPLLRKLSSEHAIEPIMAKAGEIVVMDGNLVHGSGPNFGCSDRRILLLVLNSLDNRIAVPFGGAPPRPEYISSRTFTPLRGSERAPLGALESTDDDALIGHFDELATDPLAWNGKRVTHAIGARRSR
jgi:ectoine hydroxylase